MSPETFQWVIVILSSITAGGILFAAIRGIVTKKDLKEHKQSCNLHFYREFEIRDKKLKDGDKKFTEIQSTLVDQGEQLAGVAGTVSGMADNVQTLVDHHITGGKD